MRQRWSCGRCGGKGTTTVESRVVFHNCVTPERPRRRIRMPSVRGVTREEVRNAVFAGLLDALGGDPAIWRD